MEEEKGKGQKREQQKEKGVVWVFSLFFFGFFVSGL